jgi:protein phosphatase
MSEEDPRLELNYLLKMCRDRERLFHVVAGATDNDELKQEFREYARERSDFAMRIEETIARLGGKTKQAGTIAGSLRRGLLSAKLSLGTDVAQAGIRECLNAEYYAAKDYEEALETQVTGSVRDLIAHQLQRTREAVHFLRDLRETGVPAVRSGDAEEDESGFLGVIDCYGLTDGGKKRTTNEDHFLVGELSKSLFVHQTSLPVEDRAQYNGRSQGHLLLVADGIGGQSAGELASNIAVGAIAHYVLNIMPWFFRLDLKHEDDLNDELKSALENAQAALQASSEGKPERAGMGTTLTMAYILWPRLYVVHAGDSRCYLLRGSSLEQVTRDHTVLQQLLDAGAPEVHGAHEVRLSNLLWNALGGTSQALSPEVYKASLQIGDTLLLCTDGLTKHIDDVKIKHILETEGTSKASCGRLIEAANEAGGTDNVTAVLARFRRPGDAHVPSEANQDVNHNEGTFLRGKT